MNKFKLEIEGENERRIIQESLGIIKIALQLIIIQ